MIGKTIGKYRIVGQLGRGGMGTVYKAVDEILSRDVAIKALNAELGNTETMERFRAEAVTLARLNHPGIATIHELFRSDGEFLMVMELVRGETLDRISDRIGAFPPEHAVYLIDKVLSALEHAHRAGIVHRDMKPANVMVSQHGGVKIMDFGVALVRGADHTDGYMMGTPAYMPPEQVLGQEVDGRADLYAVGVIFYRLLTGTLPFIADTPVAMLQKQISDVPTPLHVHREGLPDWCENAIQRALAKSAADRFQTAEEFRETLGKATGLVTMQLTKALSIHMADLERVTPSQPGALERFGLTPAPRLFASASTTGLVSETVRTPTAPGIANRLRRIVQGAAIALRRKRSPMAVFGLPILIGGVAVLAIVVLRRPTAAPKPVSSSPRVAVSSPLHAASAPAPRAASAPPPRAASSSAPRAISSPAPRVAPPSPPSKAARSSPRPAPIEPADKAVSAPPAAPFMFKARALVRDGNRHRERECQVVLADGKVRVEASDDHRVLHSVPYDGIVSISYSRGRDPFSYAEAGAERVARASGGVFGIYRLPRHWVSLRTADAKDPFVVLRLGDDPQAARVITTLEERTGRKARLVTQPNDDN